MHSGRRGGVTAAVDIGIDGMNIKAVGNWSSEVVDSYYCPRCAGVKVTAQLIKYRIKISFSISLHKLNLNGRM